MAADAQLLGRVTYEGFAKAWPTMEGTGEFGEKMNSMPKFVVSKTLTSADWENSTILSGDLADEVTQLKGRYDNVLVAGSARLAQGLLAADLVDELRLMVFPVVLGSGKRLFADARRAEAVRARRDAAVGRRRAADAAPEGRLALDRLEPERAREPRRGALERLVEAAAHARLGREALDLQHAARAVRLQVGAADDAVADEQRQHVVAEHALVLALVDLDQVVEAEQAAQERPVPHQVVERAQQHCAAVGAPSSSAPAGTTTGGPPSSTSTRRTSAVARRARRRAGAPPSRRP